jgi:hypothetical protein
MTIHSPRKRGQRINNESNLTATKHHRRVLNASFKVLLSASSANTCQRWSRTSRSFSSTMSSSSKTSLSPRARRIAAADLFGRAAGDMVKRVSKEEMVRTLLCVRGAEGVMELMACDVDVSVSACVMSCFSFAYKAVRSGYDYYQGEMRGENKPQRRASGERRRRDLGRRGCVEPI